MSAAAWLTRASHRRAQLGLAARRCAFIAGAASALALAPVNAWPVLLDVPVAVWLIEARRAAAGGVADGPGRGWWFGFGFFLLARLDRAGFLVDAKTFGWLLPFAVIGLPAGLALSRPSAFGVRRAMWTRGAVRILTSPSR